MDRRLCGIGLCLAAALINSGALLSAAELPTVAEVLAIHRANQAKLSQLHLQLAYTQETTEASCRADHLKADQMEQSSTWFSRLTPADIKSLEIETNGKKVSGDEAYAVLKQMSVGTGNQSNEIQRLRAQKPWRQFQRMQLLLNGEDYQVREPISSFRTEEEMAKWSFPTVPLTSERMSHEFAGMRIHSRSSSASPPTRWCLCRDSNETGYISTKHFGDLNGADLPPYTAALRPRWDNRHLIDTFYSATDKNYRIVKLETIDGRKLIVMDSLVLANERTPRLLLRGWIDLEQGAIPIRVFETQVIETAQLDTFDSWTPSSFRSCSYGKTVNTIEIRQLSNGGFYPIRTVREDWSADADAPQLSEAEWADVRAGKRDRPASVVHRRYEWNSQVAEITTEWAANFFVMPFPNDQKLFDFDAEKMLGALDRKPLVKVGQAAPPLTIARWVDGKDRSLDDFKGQIVVLDFWGLWCGPCRSSVPRLKQLQATFATKPVAFISIHTAESDPQKLVSRISEFATNEDWKYIACIDSGKMLEDSATTTDYGIQHFPTTVIVGPDGTIIYVDPDLDGPLCDTTDEKLLAEFEKKVDNFFQERCSALGETWPLPEGLSDEEKGAILERIEHRFIIQQIEQALKPVIRR